MRRELPLARSDSVDRILHPPHLADDRGVEARPEDEGADHLEEPRGHRRIARTEARLDERLALPELGPVREVGAIAVERQHERAHPALRPQSQIDAEGVALLGDRLERVRDEPHRLGEEVAVGDRPILAARGVPVVAVDDDQVNVGGVVELVAAELAHAEHREPRRRPVRRPRRAVGVRQRFLRPSPGGLETHVGQVRQLLGGHGEVGVTQDVAAADAEQVAVLESAQRVHAASRGA